MVRLSEHEGIEGQVFVVTGGHSAVGAALCLELMGRGAHEVRCFDSHNSTSAPLLPSLMRSRVNCITGDIRRREQTDKALLGVNCVFHLASHGISGKEMLQARQIDEVNLTGTCNILDSCVKCGVERMVFVSTYNAVFGGQSIVNGNEMMDYFPTETHLDAYGRCRALAEQLVLKSNGRPLKVKTGGKLYTCSIRPAAVYGPHEEHHVPRFVDPAQKGLFLYQIGGPEVKTDWVYVDNLVQALLLASMGLIDNIPGRHGAPACGQAYFIADGVPVNSFAFMQPLLKGLGYQLPDRRMTVKSAMIIAWVFWGIYGLMFPWLNKEWFPDPLFLPAEVHKVGITHYFSILKARQQLGYVPFVDPKEGMRRTLEFWKDKLLKGVVAPELYFRVFVIVGMTLCFCCGFVPPPFMGILEGFRRVLLSLFGGQQVIQAIFVIACVAHVGEGMYAWRLARRVDPANAKAWFWQTVLYGGFSLRFLLRRSRHGV